MNDKQIERILSGRLPIRTKIMRFLVCLKKYIIHFKRGKFKGLKNIEGLEKYNISANSLSSKNRKHGISGFARLRNGGEFLEQVIESHIPFMDEIILVDNNSEDNTRAICQKLQKKHPNKVKIYKYEPEVYKLGTEEYACVSEKSVHDMSYYYTRVLSRTTYKYAIKIDDDHIVIPNILGKIVNDIRNNGLNKFLAIGLYNVREVDKELYLPYNSPFAGLFGDFGFFPVSEKTYFVKDKIYENFVHNLRWSYGGLGFFHLKLLKKGQGIFNYEGKTKEKVMKLQEGGLYKLPQKIGDEFCSLVNLKNVI